MSLDDMIADDAESIFGSASHMPGTETFTYCPHEGADFETTCQVFRDRPMIDKNGLPVKKTVIFLPVSQLNTLTVGKDRVRIAWPNKRSTKIETIPVGSLVSEDAGMYELILG